jgi:hypothetical protein
MSSEQLISVCVCPKAWTPLGWWWLTLPRVRLTPQPPSYTPTHTCTNQGITAHHGNRVEYKSRVSEFELTTYEQTNYIHGSLSNNYWTQNREDHITFCFLLQLTDILVMSLMMLCKCVCVCVCVAVDCRASVNVFYRQGSLQRTRLSLDTLSGWGQATSSPWGTVRGWGFPPVLGTFRVPCGSPLFPPWRTLLSYETFWIWLDYSKTQNVIVNGEPHSKNRGFGAKDKLIFKLEKSPFLARFRQKTKRLECH